MFARLYVTDGWHFIHTWISIALPHHSLKGKAWVHKTTYYRSACAMPEKCYISI